MNEALPRLPLTDQCCELSKWIEKIHYLFHTNTLMPNAPHQDSVATRRDVGRRIAGIFDDENFSQADAVRVLFDVAVVACKFFEKEVAKGNIEWRKPQ